MISYGTICLNWLVLAIFTYNSYFHCKMKILKLSHNIVRSMNEKNPFHVQKKGNKGLENTFLMTRNDKNGRLLQQKSRRNKLCTHIKSSWKTQFCWPNSFIVLTWWRKNESNMYTVAASVRTGIGISAVGAHNGPTDEFVSI